MGDAVEPHFPPEVWELIFGNCSFPDLKRFRSVCHRWNAIVMGCLSFRRRCLVRFYGAELREVNDPARPPLTNGNILFVVVVVRVDNDWSEFGQYVENLSFHMSVIPVGMFFRMLRHCPNLKRLELYATGLLAGPVDNGFQLESVEEFDVSCLYPKNKWKRASVIDLFGPVFPRLKTFSLNWVDHFKKGDHLNLIRFIQRVQGSLQTFSLEYKTNLLKELCSMNQLHLKQAALNVGRCLPPCNTALWTRFCKTQQSLEELSLMNGLVSNKFLCVASQNLPNLKKLCANLSNEGQLIPTFLSHLIRVEHVEICANQVKLDLHIPLSPSVKKFHLSQAEISSGIETLTTSPTIENLTLERCYLEERIVPSNTQKVTSLKHLTLVECGMFPTMLDHILSCRPSLETVRLERVSSVCKEMIAKLLNQSPKLREIVLCKCYGFWSSEDELMSHYYGAYGVAERSRKVRFVIEEFTEDDEDY